MSKKNLLNKIQVEQKILEDNNDNKSISSNDKISKKIHKNDIINDNKISNDVNNDTSNDTNKKIKKVTKYFAIKDAKYKDEQEITFNKLKDAIGFENNSFFSNKINKEKISNEIFNEIKLYFYCKIWNRIDSTKDRAYMAIIRNVFEHYGYEITSKNVVLDKKTIKKFYAVKITE